MKGKRKLHPAQKKKDKIAVSQWQEFQDQKNEELKSGGPITEKSNDQLFYIDKLDTAEGDSRKSKWKNKPSFADKFFAGNGNVKPALLQHDVSTQKKIIAEISQKKQKISTEKSVPVPVTSSVPQYYDLWADSTTATKAKKIQKTTLPAPGESYHPNAEAHQDLIGEAVAIALDQEEKEKHDAAFMAKLQVFSEEAQKSNWNDLLAGINPQEEDEDDVTSWEPVEHINLPFAQRKTKKMRQLELKKKLHQAKLANEELNKKMKKDLSKLDEINQEIDKERQERKDKEEMLEKSREAMPAKPIRTGYQTLKSKVPAVLLSDELPSNLRTLKALDTKQLLHDKLYDFQKRQMMEVVTTDKPLRQSRKKNMRLINKRSMMLDEEKKMNITL